MMAFRVFPPEYSGAPDETPDGRYGCSSAHLAMMAFTSISLLYPYPYHFLSPFAFHSFDQYLSLFIFCSSVEISFATLRSTTVTLSMLCNSIVINNRSTSLYNRIVREERTRVALWGACWNRYYRLEIEYFMSTLAQETLEIMRTQLLW